MKIFYTVLIFLALMVSGCSTASEESPTITLKGDKDIHLKVGQVIYEPGYTASDPQDGDITDKVKVTSNINFYKEGQYYVNYSVKDSDGNVARASRIVTISNSVDDNYAYNGDQYQDDGKSYDFAEYGYIYQVYEQGKNGYKDILHYDRSGNYIDRLSLNFERNKNDNSIYRYVNNTLTNHDFIGLDEIRSYDSNSYLLSRHKRILKIGDEYEENALTCRVIENLPTFNTYTVTGIEDPSFAYLNVLHIRCNGNGEEIDHYYANGFGEILKVKDGEYYITDKNSINAKITRRLK